MLVTRHAENELNPWSFNKLETSFTRKSSASPRMSNTGFETPLSTGTDWQGTYSFLPPGEPIFAQTYDHVSNSNDNSQSQTQPRSAGVDGSLEIDVKNEANSPLGHRRSVDPLGLRQKAPTPIQEQPEHAGEPYAPKAESVHDESLVSTDAPGLSLGSNPLGSVPSGQPGDLGVPHTGEEQAVPKDGEEDDVVDDEEMVEGDGEATSQPQTAAERTAQRRKMKRFR